MQGNEPGDTRIDTLRQTYRDQRLQMRVATNSGSKVDRTGGNSLSAYLKTDRVNEKAPNIRYASDQRFGEAHRKTSALQAGLFCRLAE
jgi:hypothetical protein